MATTTTDAGTLVEQGTPLTRNHWFDGKFLRADDLARDQDYHRSALRLANQAGGFGVVHGLEVTLAGAELVLQPGLGITADGELLLLSSEFSVGVDALIAATAATPSTPATAAASDGRASFGPCEAVAVAEAPTATATGWRIYRITLGPHRALCGFEDVVGALCDRACVTERQRPYQLEGVRLRARLQPVAVPPLAGIEAGGRHARSRIASALFALDDGRITPLPDDGGRLLSPLWCSGTGFAGGGELTLGYLVRGAGTADFVDLWSGRRERMGAQAEGYWQRRTRLRPFADFIAQVAQFQCQLTQLFRSGGVPADEGGDCEALRGMVRELEAQLKEALNNADPETVDWTQASSVTVMRRMGRFVQQAAPLLKGAVDRVLLERGIVELPPAGFLPVTPAAGDIARQVQRLVGPGVQLQLCSAPLDAIGHLFQEAQHSARTSMTRGLVDAADKPLLQIIVPDGEALGATAPPPPPPGYAVTLHNDPALFALVLASALRDGDKALKDTTTRLASGAAAAPVNGVTAVAAAASPAMAAAAAPKASAAGMAEVLARRLGTKAGRVLGEASLGSTAAAAPTPGTGATAAPPPATSPTVVADGAGRVVQQSGEPTAFALAVRGLPPQGDVSGEEFEGAWMELDAASDPFAAAPGASVALRMLLSESERPDADFPPGAGAGMRIRASAALVLNSNPAEAERMRAQIEQATGLTGGEVRLAALEGGKMRYGVYARSVPGIPDGLVREVDLSFAAPTVALQRVVTAGRSHWVVALPLADTGVLMLECVPQAAGASRIQLRVLRLASQTTPLTHVPPPGAGATTGTTSVTVLATLREDALALAPGAAPRLAAEAGLAELDKILKADAPTAAQRLRLLGPAAAPATPAATGLRGVHDWVLFRRPVDARCKFDAAPAPVPVPDPPPVPAPVATVTRYRASVLRLVPSFNGDALKTTLDALAAGELPTTKAASFALAAALDYEGQATKPVQTIAALAPAFAQAGFGPVVQVAVVQGAAGVDAALEAKRATSLSIELGGGSRAADVQRLPALPAAMQALDGAIVYIVMPLQAAPPPEPEPVPVPAPQPVPPAPTVTAHRQRVMLLNTDGQGRFNALGGVTALANRSADMLKELERIGGRYFEVDFQLAGTNVNIDTQAGGGFNSLAAAAQAMSGLGANQVPVLLRATDDNADKRKNAQLAAAAMFDKLSGPGAQTQVVVCIPTPPQIQSQHDALTLLFTKG